MAEQVNYKKKSYVAWMAQCSKCAIALQGQDAVKALGEDFLPRANGMDGIAYTHYKRRASFINFSDKTLEAWHGSLHRKKAVLRAPSPIEDYAKDIDLARNTLEEAIKTTTQRILATSRHAIYLDYSVDAGRPYIRHIKGCDIINWIEDYVDGRYQPIMVVVKSEKAVLDPKDIFATDACYEQYDVHYLNPTTKIYQVMTWKTRGKNGAPEFVGTIIPEPTGAPLNYIPMVCFTPDGLTFETTKPIIMDVVDANVTHYNCYADYLWGSHWTVMPTYLFTGIPDEAKGDIIIGGQNALVTDNELAKGTIIQYSGVAIPEMRQNLGMLQDIISKLGARLLEQARKQPETAESTAIRNSGESNILANLANTVQDGLMIIFGWMADWEGVRKEDIVLQLNTDFVPDSFTTADIKELFDSLVMKAITPETYVNQMNQKDMYPNNFDAKAEIERLEEVIASGQATMSNGVNQLTNMNTGRSSDSNVNSITTNPQNG